MDSASLVGGTALLGLVALVLRLWWRLLLGVLIFGPPSYGGVFIGHFVGIQFESAWLGFLAAVVAAGVLGELMCGSLRAFQGAR